MYAINRMHISQEVEMKSGGKKRLRLRLSHPA